MGAAVSITRLDLTASELRKAASGEKNSAAARRILALALVLDGVDRKTAAETCGMDRQTLRDWVHRYNAAGLAGLRNLKSPGPGSKLTARQQAELAELVEAGPDPAVHGVVRWRRVDLRDELQRRWAPRADDYARFQIARLDGLAGKLSRKAEDGDLRNIDRLLRLSDRLDRYRGFSKGTPAIAEDYSAIHARLMAKMTAAFRRTPAPAPAPNPASEEA